MERRKKGIVLILIAILIFGVFAGVEFFGKKKKEPAQTSATAAIPSATPIPTSVVTITRNHRQMQKPKKIKKHCFGRNTSRDITAITSKCYGI